MSRKKLLDTARATFIKIWDTAADEYRRIGKKDRRATPPKGGDGREHRQRTKEQEKPDIPKDTRVGSHEAFLQEQEMKKFADSRVEMEKLWGKHLKKGKNINN
jgi:hypothetical protein